MYRKIQEMIQLKSAWQTLDKPINQIKLFKWNANRKRIICDSATGINISQLVSGNGYEKTSESAFRSSFYFFHSFCPLFFYFLFTTICAACFKVFTPRPPMREHVRMHPRTAVFLGLSGKSKNWKTDRTALGERVRSFSQECDPTFVVDWN